MVEMKTLTSHLRQLRFAMQSKRVLCQGKVMIWGGGRGEKKKACPCTLVKLVLEDCKGRRDLKNKS